MSRTPESSASNPTGAHRPRQQPRRRWPSLVVVLVASAGFAATILFDSRASALSMDPESGRPATEAETLAAQESNEDFSRFSHTQTHAALPCLLCHRRESNSTRPSLPGHTPCAGCHSRRFAGPESPICTICHTNAATGALKAFPALKSFGVTFDHALHTAGAARAAGGCAACHTPARRGVALSIPAGPGAHAACYQCHTPNARASDRDISSCGTCHRWGSYERAPIWTRAYTVSFSHARHTRQGLACADCHQVRSGLPAARQVTAPAPLEHHAAPRAMSCMTCHNDRRAFGIRNFLDCKRCHQGPHFYF